MLRSGQYITSTINSDKVQIVVRPYRGLLVWKVGDVDVWEGLCLPYSQQPLAGFAQPGRAGDDTQAKPVAVRPMESIVACLVDPLLARDARSTRRKSFEGLQAVKRKTWNVRVFR